MEVQSEYEDRQVDENPDIERRDAMQALVVLPLFMELFTQSGEKPDAHKRLWEEEWKEGIVPLDAEAWITVTTEEGGKKIEKEISITYRNGKLIVGGVPCRMYAQFIVTIPINLTEFRVKDGILTIRGKSARSGRPGASRWDEKALRSLGEALLRGQRRFNFRITEGRATNGFIAVSEP